MWLLDDSCSEIVHDAWNINKVGSFKYVFLYKCKYLLACLRKWNREAFCNVQSCVSMLNHLLSDLQQKIGQWSQTYDEMETNVMENFKNVYVSNHEVEVLDICRELEQCNLPLLSDQEE
ncbi:ribonuclease H [Senna tora]|uniref:Ribonuclease H n=1 Tax=Senna tora TaxID=362788 RepID=A0A834WT30_9FABA|nr:ribonuclease H [Senna tora]